MNPEEKELFKRSIALSEENNRILRGMQRSMRLSRFMSIIYWIVIIGSFVGGFYLVQPYLEQLNGMYANAKNVIDNIGKTNNQ